MAATPGAKNGAQTDRLDASVNASSRPHALGSFANANASTLPGAVHTSKMFGASLQCISPQTPNGSNSAISPNSSEARRNSSAPIFEASAQSTEAILSDAARGSAGRLGRV